MTTFDSRLHDNRHTNAVSRNDVLGLGGGNILLGRNTGTLTCIESNLQQLDTLGFEVMMAEPRHWILRRSGTMTEIHLYSTDELALFTWQQAASRRDTDTLCRVDTTPQSSQQEPS